MQLEEKKQPQEPRVLLEDKGKGYYSCLIPSKPKAYYLQSCCASTGEVEGWVEGWEKRCGETKVLPRMQSQERRLSRVIKQRDQQIKPF